MTPPNDRYADRAERFDDRTLYYDAIYNPRSGMTKLIAPPLRNLRRPLKTARWADGAPTWIYDFNFKRFSEIWMRGLRAPTQVSVEGAQNIDAPVSTVDQETFENLNCAVLKSRDNEIDWILDWIRYHARHHGLEGLVLFDNGSNTYSRAELLERIRATGELQAAVIVDAPFKFGHPNVLFDKFYQVSMLNVARTKYFPRAAAVLSVDLDEYIWPIAGSSIFDAVRRNPLGYILFEGVWLDGPPEGAERPRVIDQVFEGPNSLCAHTKFIVRPKGPLGSAHWDVHGAVRGMLKKAFVSRRHGFWHLREISTHWKKLRGTALLGDGGAMDRVRNDGAASAFSAALSTEAPT